MFYYEKEDLMPRGCIIEEVFKQKIRQRSSLLFGGTEFFQFLAALAILHQDDLKNRMNLSISSYHPSAIYPFLYIILVQFILFCYILLVQNSWRGKGLNKFCPQTAETTFTFSSGYSTYILLLQEIKD